ncbi:type II toxin-antitoxin system VapC family toxin [Desulfonema limicola]|nr:PIN domain-containing protein [Desulfonema limicola]
MTEIFLDTSYVIALSSVKDHFHQKALETAEKIQAEKSKLITTRAVMLEIGNALSGFKHRTAAVKLLNALESDPDVGIVSLTESLYSQGFSLFCKRQNKNWGLVDCISFVVMQERKIFYALTADEHFQQAGFRAMLRD